MALEIGVAGGLGVRSAVQYSTLLHSNYVGRVSVPVPTLIRKQTRHM